MATRVRRRKSRHVAPAAAKAVAAPRAGDSLAALAGLSQGGVRDAASSMLADVGSAPQLRADAAAQSQAASAGALAWAGPGEIGFAAGPVGQATHLHELAHSVQFAGGSRGTAALLPNAHEAEREAHQAVPILQRGQVPRLSGYRGPGPLFDKPGSRALPTNVQVPVADIEQWGTDPQYIWLRAMRRHVLQVAPGTSEAQIAEILKGVRDRAVTGDVGRAIAGAKKAGQKSLNIEVSRQLNQHLSERFKREAGEGGASGAGGKDGTGTGGGGGGAGKGSGAGAGGIKLGISDEPGESINAKTASDAVEQTLRKVQAENEARHLGQTEQLDQDGVRRFWPDELANPESRAKVLDLMKLLVGEPPKLPDGQTSKLPARLSSDEARFLLQIASAEPTVREEVIARLKGGPGLAGGNGQTMAQVLESAFENAEIKLHQGEMDLPSIADPFSGPGRDPIENRPVHGGIVSGNQSALSVGERAIWRFEVHDDRDAFRVPHIYINWVAQRTDPDTKLVEEVSSERTHIIPVREQGIINDGEFDFTARKVGHHVVKAIVHHNFFKPAYFEEPFVVEDEFKQGQKAFEKENEGLVAKTDGWDAELYDHGGNFDYRLGRMRRGTLDPKARATTDNDLIANLEAQVKQVNENVARIVAQDPSQAEDLNKARDERIDEIYTQIAAIRDQRPAGATALVTRGQFVSRVNGVEDVSMQLSCLVNEVDVIDPDTKRKRTDFRMTLNDGSARGSRKIYHFTAQENSVQAAQRSLFLQVAQAYPFGTVTLLFQGYDQHRHAATSSFVQFEKKTDTIGKDIKSVVFDEHVDTLVNVVGFVLSIIPVTAPIGITMTVVYNSAKGLSDNLDDAQNGTFKATKAGIALGDLVLNLLPLAPKVIKVGRATYFVIKASSIAGGVVLMGAVGLQQVRDLRTGTIDSLVKKKMRYDQLMHDNKSHPDIVSGSLEREIKQLTKEAANATQSVFTQMAAQTVFMHVISTAADKGFEGLKGPGPVETRVMKGAKERADAITPLKEQGGMLHQDGAAPKYDYKQSKIVADENTIKPGELAALSREAGVDGQLTKAKMLEGERAAVGQQVAGLDVDVVPGTKTEIVPGPNGRPELRVKPGATAAEVMHVLKENAPALKPAPAVDTTHFVEPKPVPGNLAETVSGMVTARLSGKAKKAFTDIQVEIVGPGELGPGKTRATLDIKGRKARLRFEGEPRPGVLAEEIAHLEQLADPKFAEQRKKLEKLGNFDAEPGAAGGKKARDWSSVSEVDKVDGHKARLELETDAQRRVIDDLQAQLKTKPAGPNDARVHDVEAAFRNLEQLRSKLAKFNAMAEELAATGKIGNRPDSLDKAPQLTNLSTVDKHPPPADWTSMKVGEFVKAYQDMYPDTTLTTLDLEQRHANGQRLNPKTGKQKNPNLVDNPMPDVAAEVTNKKSLKVDDLNLDQTRKQNMDKLLKERDAAMAERNRVSDLGDEVEAGRLGAKVNEASRKIGEAHAEAYMAQEYPQFERGYPEPGKPSRSGDFDQVWFKYSDKTKTVVVEVVVIEAKGGSGELGARMVDGLRAQQGSGLYFKGIMDSMQAGTPQMKKAAAFLNSVPSENVTFKLVRAPIKMTKGANPVSVVVTVEIGDFNRKDTMKKR